jgi:hypothetical protein
MGRNNRDGKTIVNLAAQNIIVTQDHHGRQVGDIKKKL